LLDGSASNVVFFDQVGASIDGGDERRVRDPEVVSGALASSPSQLLGVFVTRLSSYRGDHALGTRF
jgi:hypothetical protein